ncbi:hypothetical protein QUA71_28130 [Microcoleus sp. MON1_C5]|uniref:hypothetical protein n=1 Tax=Microcoleus sp. MON1_C5 TaxID=2818828 RepID=UPI002FD7689F
MEITATPWHETRTLIPPRIEMLQDEGMVQQKKSFLKSEAPQSATAKLRFVHYNESYIKYCFLKEFYDFLFDGTRQELLSEGSKNELIALVTQVVIDFVEYCNQQSLEENSRELFREFCKVSLFK